MERQNLINEQLRKTISHKQIALNVGSVSRASIGRHALKCVTTKTKKSIRNQIPIVLWPDGSAFIRRDYGDNGCSIQPVTVAEINKLDDDDFCIWEVRYSEPDAEAQANIAATEARATEALAALEPIPENQ